MHVSTCFRLFLIASLLFLAFGCSKIKSDKPCETISVIEESLPEAKKTPEALEKEPDLQPVQKTTPDSVQSPPAQPPTIYEIGMASFYADLFQSRKTASGERFDQKAETAAHKQLPFGTKVKVTNKKNKKSVIVTINDRGPFIKGRIIDLSKFAFSRIGNLRSGIVDVEIQIIDKIAP